MRPDLYNGEGLFRHRGAFGGGSEYEYGLDGDDLGRVGDTGIEALSERDPNGIPFEVEGGLSLPAWTRTSEEDHTRARLGRKLAKVHELRSHQELRQWRMGMERGYCDDCIAQYTEVLPPTVRVRWHTIYQKLEKAGLRKTGGENNRRTKEACPKCQPAQMTTPAPNLSAVKPIDHVSLRAEVDQRLRAFRDKQRTLDPKLKTFRDEKQARERQQLGALWGRRTGR